MTGRTTRTVIEIYVLISTVMSGFIALVVIASAVVFPYLYPDVESPKFIESWGGIIVGFYFGSFLTLLTKIVEHETAKPDAPQGPAQPDAPG